MLVGEACRDAPEGLEALAFALELFEPTLDAAVAQHQQHAVRTRLLVEQRRGRHVHLHVLPATSLDLLVELRDGDAAREHLAGQLRQGVFRGDEGLHRPPDHGGAGVLQQPARDRVELLDAPVLVDHHRPGEQSLEDVPEGASHEPSSW
jgi:hypothetical protein